jgi:hypothetical protein
MDRQSNFLNLNNKMVSKLEHFDRSRLKATPIKAFEPLRFSTYSTSIKPLALQPAMFEAQQLRRYACPLTRMSLSRLLRKLVNSSLINIASGQFG